MSYKNDSNLVIANRFSDASSAAKAQMWETYDRLRDLTVSGSGTGTGFESAGGLLYNIASLLAPSSFATVFGGSETMNIAGTSYYSKTNTGTSYGVDSLYNYSGFPSGAASINSIYGLATGLFRISKWSSFNKFNIRTSNRRSFFNLEWLGI